MKQIPFPLMARHPQREKPYSFQTIDTLRNKYKPLGMTLL
jgi:hypothetical protein